AYQRGDSMQLTQLVRHENDGHIGLAGFVEDGVTVQRAAGRVVNEESRIRVKKLRCVTSPRWPFPQSLMTAFIADYADGGIVVDKKQLLTADC
ncbi:NAD(+) diphosphatase, partial [Klebsiella pneumoniae]|nr:NAD(+) diphosphatase [Klebsiella pneumoniae]